MHCLRGKGRNERGRAACNKHNMIIVFSDPAGRSSRIVDRIKRYELYARRPRRLPRWRRLRGQPAVRSPGNIGSFAGKESKTIRPTAHASFCIIIIVEVVFSRAKVESEFLKNLRTKGSFAFFATLARKGGVP